MEIIQIKRIQKKESVVCIDFECTEKLDVFFTSKQFFYECTENIEMVPDSIVVIPFVVNVLPLVWLTNSTLKLYSIDRIFYESIDSFKQGYVEMYPMFDFQGIVEANEKIDNKYDCKNNVGIFFSGGVDAFATLLAHIDEHPRLITVWGADVKLSDEKGWNNVILHTNKTTNEFALQTALFIKTNFREFLNESELNNLVKISKDSWWHGFQHGIGLIGLASIVAYIYKFSVVYIASSFTARDNVTCASSPTIDNFVKFGNTVVSHDQYGCNRQNKITSIVKAVTSNQKNIDVRVCWESEGGTNCCRCEKCLRTMMGFWAEGVDPKKFGFNYDKSLLKSIRILQLKMPYYPTFVKVFWKDIQDRFKETSCYSAESMWIKNYDFLKPPTLKNNVYKAYVKIKSKLRRIL